MVTIRCDNLRVALGGRPVLQGVDLMLEPGRLIGVIGPNGAGKSTFARALLRLLPLSEGRVLIDGEDAARLPPAAMARRIAYLPQGQELHWPLSVERLVGLGRLPHLAPLSRIGTEDQAAIEMAMAQAGMLAFRDRIASELSGGERARAMLARALATGAPALIADEPLASLDPGHQIEVMTLLAARAQAGALVIVVLHDLAIAARHCDRLVLFDQGSVVSDGAPEQVLDDLHLARTYGVRAWRGEVDGLPLLVPFARAD